MSRADAVTLLYIVGFALFIVGLRMVRGPRTAVNGNLIAAGGMGIALVATLLDERIGDWVLIVIGIAIGTDWAHAAAGPGPMHLVIERQGRAGWNWR